MENNKNLIDSIKGNGLNYVLGSVCNSVWLSCEYPVRRYVWDATDNSVCKSISTHITIDIYKKVEKRCQ